MRVNSNPGRLLTGLAAVWLYLLPAAYAVEFELDGDLVQGGLVQGRIVPGSKVQLDGERIQIDENGRFLLGFDRDAGTTADLRITYPDGRQVQRSLTIEQRDYKIQRIDGLPQRKVTPSAADLERIQRESESMDAARARTRETESLYLDDFIWPVSGRISGVYGSQRILNGEPRRPHYGVDIAAPEGTPIRAPASGVVAFTHPGMYFNGATVLLDHGHGLTSTYIHLSEIRVEAGNWIDQGQVIGAVGASGRATGPHLHWGVDWLDAHLDPQRLVGPMPDN